MDGGRAPGTARRRSARRLGGATRARGAQLLHGVDVPAGLARRRRGRFLPMLGPPGGRWPRGRGSRRFVAPELVAAEPVPAAARAALRCRVLSASLFVGNPAIGSYAAEMHRLRPDVAVLSEATPALIGGVERARALTDLPHRMTVDRTDPFAMVVASRWPLTEREVVVVRSRPVLVKATVEVAGHRLRLFGVHVVSPESGRYEWVQGMAAVRAAVAPSVPGRARWGLQRHLGPPIVPRAPRHRSHRRRRRPQKALGDDGPAKSPSNPAVGPHRPCPHHSRTGRHPHRRRPRPGQRPSAARR